MREGALKTTPFPQPLNRHVNEDFQLASTSTISNEIYWGGPCSGCWFLVRFSDLILGCQDNGFIQERGVVAGTRVGVVILVPVFLGALVAVFLVVLVFFRALSWLQFRAWTGVGFLRGRLVVFFVAVLVGPFVAVLVVVLLFAFV